MTDYERYFQIVLWINYRGAFQKSTWIIKTTPGSKFISFFPPRKEKYPFVTVEQFSTQTRKNVPRSPPHKLHYLLKYLYTSSGKQKKKTICNCKHYFVCHKLQGIPLQTPQTELQNKARFSEGTRTLVMVSTHSSIVCLIDIYCVLEAGVKR